MLYVGIATLIMAMGLTWIATPHVIRLADRLGALDYPGGRKTHATPTPRIGGVAVFIGFVGGLTLAALLTGSLFSMPRVDVYWRALGVGATALFLIGLIDDLWSVSFVWKFAVQVLASGYLWFYGFRIEILSNPLGGSAIELGTVLGLCVTVLWIVGITNAVNLIDGLDGLAAGVALITTLAVAAIALYRSELGVTAASVALAGSLLGFLRYNFNPARIFLGDSGSLFLGFVLAVTSVRGSQKGPTAVAILAPLLILGLPLFDTGLAVLRRLYWIGSDETRKGGRVAHVVSNLNRVFLPDRGHIHHRLIDSGLSHRGAVLILYGVTALLALGALALVLIKSVLVGLLLVAILAALMAGFGLLLYFRGWRRRREVDEAREVPRVDGPADIDPVASPGGRASSR